MKKVIEMNSYFFENTNEASPDYPYLVDASRNLNYFAHIHNDIELVYVVSGEIDITCENQLYTVKAGDNLYSIAKQYNTTVDNLKKLNDLIKKTLSSLV